MSLRVESTDGGAVETTVVHVTQLGENKDHSPGCAPPSGGLTPKDDEDLRFGIAAGVDMVALSFVQHVSDVRAARAVLEALSEASTPLIAKLERPQAIEHLDAILAEADAVMVARGDLGLEVPLERVPRLQKEITRRARALGRPVIVATQCRVDAKEPRTTRAEGAMQPTPLRRRDALSLPVIRRRTSLRVGIKRSPRSAAPASNAPWGVTSKGALDADHGRALC